MEKQSEINDSKENENIMLSPLTLDTPKSLTNSSNETRLLKCVCCEETYNFPISKDNYLAHLYLSHRLVIADVEDIADLEEYMQYWIAALTGHELEEFCTTLLLDQLPDGTPSKNEKYYLLSDILPQDYELRKRLHTQRLKKVLAQHQFERSDRSFSRECLYCRDVITGLRSEYLEHLFNKHFLQLGKPENLVFVDELIELVQSKLESLICLFCERIFKDRVTLKEHMRKKGHKRINPNIKLYDKFFLINYKNEKPQNVKNMKNRRSKSKTTHVRSRSKSNNRPQQECKERAAEPSDKILNSDDSDPNWSDWDEDKQQLTCLFCSKKDIDFGALKSHMISSHSVDFDKEAASLSFYQKIKVVNYIRRQVHISRCITCNERCSSSDELQKHMEDCKHFGIGEKKQWDQPEYFFPTYEDDGILYFLEDRNNADDDSAVVICEDIKAAVNHDAETLSLENFTL